MFVVGSHDPGPDDDGPKRRTLLQDLADKSDQEHQNVSPLVPTIPMEILVDPSSLWWQALPTSYSHHLRDLSAQL